MKAFDSIGNERWTKQILSDDAHTYAIEVIDSLIYWVGGFEASFNLENIHYSITSPVYRPNSGYIARLNKKDGKLEWVMSDPAIEEEKWFYAIDVAPDHSMTLIGHFDYYTFTLNGEVMSNFSNGEETDGVIFRMKGIPPPPPPPAVVYKPWFEVWPNPNNGVFSIGVNSDAPKSAKFSVWDLYGRKILLLKNNQLSNPFLVNLNSLSTGAYFLRFVDEISGITQTKKIIIH